LERGKGLLSLGLGCALRGERSKGICPVGVVHLWSESTFAFYKRWPRASQIHPKGNINCI
jgi:hypothetical protein